MSVAFRDLLLRASVLLSWVLAGSAACGAANSQPEMILVPPREQPPKSIAAVSAASIQAPAALPVAGSALTQSRPVKPVANVTVPVVEEEQLLKRIQQLDKKGVGNRPLIVELARVDYLFRHADSVHARQRLTSLVTAVAEHERKIKERETPVVAQPDYTFPFLAEQKVDKGGKHRGSPGHYLVPPPPPMDLSAVLATVPTLAPGTQIPSSTLSPQDSYKVLEMSRIASSLKKQGVPDAQIQAVTNSFNESGDERSQRLADQLFKKKLGAYAPSRGPMRLERYAIAERIMKLNARGRMSPGMLQSCLQLYQGTQQSASSAKDEESKESLASRVHYLQQFMNIHTEGKKR